jgi:hypothetical protein
VRNQTIYLLLLVFITLTASCSNNDDSEPLIENLKNVSDCGITIEPDTLVSICIDGTDLALPNETITFTATFYSKKDNPSDTQFLWTVKYGNMEILNIEHSIGGTIAKSIATIKFNSNYIGNGVIGINAENATRTAITEHFVALEN